MEHKRVKREFIERLVEEVSLSEVLRHHGVVTRKLNRDSSTCLCPFHSEKTPSFIYSDNRKTYNCFGCKASGNLITLVRGLTGQDSYVSVIQHLAQVAGLPMEYEESNYSDDDLVYYDYVDSLVHTDREVISKVADIYNKQLLQPTSAEAYEYLHHYRQLKPEIIQAYNLGYCPPASVLTPLLKQSTVGGGVFGMGAKNVLLSLVRTATMMPRTDAARLPDIEPDIKENQLPVHREQLAPLNDYYETYYDRITFPIYDESGNITGVGARTLHDYRQKLGKPFKPDQAKYKNTSNRSSLYDKSKMIYGLYQVLEHHRKLSANPLARPKIDRLILVEGYLDVISLAQYGIWQGVAASGTAMKPEQIRYLFKFCKNLVLCLDGDKAGRAAALKTAKIILGEYKTGYNVRILHLPGDHDPDSYLREHSPDQFEELVESKSKGLFEYIITSMLDEYGKEQLNEAQYLEVRGQLGELYASLDPEELNERSFFVEYCAQHLNKRAKFTVDSHQLESLFKNQEEQLAREKAQQKEKEALDRYYLEVQGSKARFKNKLFLQQMQVREFEGLTIKETQVKHPRQQRDESRWGNQGYAKDFKGKTAYAGNKGAGNSAGGLGSGGFNSGSLGNAGASSGRGALGRGKYAGRSLGATPSLGKNFTRYGRGMKTTREQVQEELLHPTARTTNTTPTSNITLGTGATLPDDIVVGSDLFAGYESAHESATYHEDIAALHDYYNLAGQQESTASGAGSTGTSTTGFSGFASDLSNSTNFSTPAHNAGSAQGDWSTSTTQPRTPTTATVQQLYAQGSFGQRGNFGVAGSAGQASGNGSVTAPAPNNPTVPQFSATSFNPHRGGMGASSGFGFGMGNSAQQAREILLDTNNPVPLDKRVGFGAVSSSVPVSGTQVTPVQELDITPLTAPDVSSQVDYSATQGPRPRSLLGGKSKLTSHATVATVDLQQLRSSNKTRGAKAAPATPDASEQILNRLKTGTLGGGVGSVGGTTVTSINEPNPALSTAAVPEFGLVHNAAAVQAAAGEVSEDLPLQNSGFASEVVALPEASVGTASDNDLVQQMLFGAGSSIAAIKSAGNADAVGSRDLSSSNAGWDSQRSEGETTPEHGLTIVPDAPTNVSNATGTVAAQLYAELMHPAPPQFSGNDLFAPQYLQLQEREAQANAGTSGQTGFATSPTFNPAEPAGQVGQAGNSSEQTSFLGNNLSPDEMSLLQDYGLGFDLQSLEAALHQASLALERSFSVVPLIREQGFGNRKSFVYHNLEISVERTPQTIHDNNKYLNALQHVELRIPRILAAYLANHNLVGPQIIAPFKLKVFEFLKEFRVKATKIKHSANLDRTRDPVNLVRELVDKYQLGDIYDVEDKIYQVNLTEREIETTYKDLIQSLLKLLEACRTYVFKYLTSHARELNNVNVEIEALSQYRLLWTHCLQGVSIVKATSTDAKDERQRQRIRYAEEFLQAYQQQRMHMHTYLIDDVRKANPTPVIGFDVPAYGGMPELKGKDLVLNEEEKQALEQQELEAQIAASKLAAQQEAISAPKRNEKALGSTLSKLTQDKPQAQQPVIPDRLKGLRKEVNPQQVSLVASRLGAMAEGKVEVVKREQVDFSGSSSAFGGLSMTGMNFSGQAQGGVEFATAWGGKAFKGSGDASNPAHPQPEAASFTTTPSSPFSGSLGVGQSSTSSPFGSVSGASTSSPFANTTQGTSSPFGGAGQAPSGPFGQAGGTAGTSSPFGQAGSSAVTSSPFTPNSATNPSNPFAQGTGDSPVFTTQVGSQEEVVTSVDASAATLTADARDQGSVVVEGGFASVVSSVVENATSSEQVLTSATSSVAAYVEPTATLEVVEPSQEQDDADSAHAGALAQVFAELDQVADSPDFLVDEDSSAISDDSGTASSSTATGAEQEQLSEILIKPTVLAYEDSEALRSKQELAGKRAQHLEDEEARQLAEQERAETEMYDAAAAVPPTKPKRGKLSPTAPSLEKLEEFASMPFMSASMFASIQSDKIKEASLQTQDKEDEE